MKKRVGIIALIISSLCFSNAALADHHHDRDHHENWGSHHQRHDAHWGGDHGHHWNNQHHGWNRSHGNWGRPRGGWGGPSPGWHRGGYMPPRYMHNSGYWVNDWQRYRLPPPPRGHRWLHVNGDFILAAVATGVITSIILN